MKIMLIDPPFYRIFGFYNRYFPTGLVAIGTFLSHAGCDVIIYDADCNDDPKYMDYSLLPQFYQQYLDSFKDQSHSVWKEVKETIASINPDVVGISIWTTYAASAFCTAMLCKKVNPNCTVVMGGPHAAFKTEEILKISPHVDYIVRGEGEYPMFELIKQISSGANKFSSIPNLSFRGKGRIIHTPPNEATKKLEIFPFPDRTLLMNEDKYTSEDMGLIMTSRGCPFACSYCATNTKRVSYRPIEHILEEIKLVISNYGTGQFSFKDDSFTVNKKRVEQFCDKLLTDKFNINWECNTRVDLVNESLLVKMEKAGCNSIKVGIESGSERILKKMNKGITHEQVRNAARLFRKVGIHWTGYFMMGVPGETVEDVYKTLQLMYEVQPDFASIGVYEPFPGTAMFAEGIKQGLIKPEMALMDFYTTLPNHYYKKDIRQQTDTIDSGRFSALEQEIKDKFHTYNKNFRRILNRAKSRASIYAAEPRILLADVRKYLSWR